MSDVADVEFGEQGDFGLCSFLMSESSRSDIITGEFSIRDEPHSHLAIQSI